MRSDFEHDFFLAFEGEAGRALAGELEKALSSLEVNAFMDTQIEPGATWAEEILARLTASRTFVPLLGGPPTSDYFKSEIHAAIELTQRDGRRSIIPVFLNEALPTRSRAMA